jgi:cobalt-zinc-cadmium efflux system outer membrane protein
MSHFRFLLIILAGLSFSTLETQAQAVALAPPVTSASADTVALSLPEAEQRFVQNNLSLIAQQYNVSIAQAQAIQARLIDNPTITLEQNAVNKAINREHFDGHMPGEVVLQVQQLFSIAGRRRAANKVAQQAAVVEQLNLADLLRNLRYQLRTTYFDLFFKQQTVRTYDTEINSLSRTVGLYQTQFEKGNIPLKEVIRLRAFLFSLENERQALRTDMAAEQADLHVLLRDPAPSEYRPQVSLPHTRALTLAGVPEQQLADTAQAVRADLRARRADVQRQNLNLRYQRALASPDLAVGYTYDKAGSYINNYNAITLGVAVPIFNRNQGNIQAARAQIAGSQALVDLQQQAVQRDVHEAYQLARQNDELFQGTDRDTAPFSRLMTGIEQSYAKRLLSVVEYLDFYESYKNNLVQLNTLRANRVRAFEQLNFAVGRTVFRPE